jgi:hypothetical protein
MKRPNTLKIFASFVSLVSADYERWNAGNLRIEQIHATISETTTPSLLQSFSGPLLLKC